MSVKIQVLKLKQLVLLFNNVKRNILPVKLKRFFIWYLSNKVRVKFTGPSA